MILIYSPNSSPRLQYILQLLFHSLSGTNYELTQDLQRFTSYNGPRLNYSKNKTGDEIFIRASDFLFDKEVKPQSIGIAERMGMKILFAHNDISDLPFDPFAASFYLVSRYEEYLPFKPDGHDRFPAPESLNWKEGFHEIPVVNHYALWIQQLIRDRYPGVVFPSKKYQFQLTYDVDMAFAFREKGAMRNAGGFLKSLSHLNIKEIAHRTKVLTGQEEDPFDTFEYQRLLHEKYRLKPIYFFLVGDYASFDKNISWRNIFFSDLVKQIASENEIGMHSSYDSNRYPKKIKIEKQRLEKISGKKIFRNRQHFLKIRFPLTYRTLLENEITEDYTMGYSETVGFRAGIASPFQFYDLEKEEVTALTIYPFAVMDAALHYYLHCSPDEALHKGKSIVDEVKKVNGSFLFLAHNDLISDEGPWIGWRERFEKLIEYAAE